MTGNIDYRPWIFAFGKGSMHSDCMVKHTPHARAVVAVLCSVGEMEVSAKRRLKLVEAGSVIFEDADEDFRSLDFVAKHFEEYVHATLGTASERDP